MATGMPARESMAARQPLPVDGLSLLLVAGTLLAQIGDVVTTQVGLHRPGISELNPLMAMMISRDPITAYLLKILVISEGILVLLWRCSGITPLRWGLGILFLLSSIGLLHNLPVLNG